MTALIRKIILQTPATYETRSVRLACLLVDGYEIINSTIENLFNYKNELLTGEAMPVGTVEFIRMGMSLSEFDEPVFSCYPQEMSAWFKRKIEQCQAEDLEDGFFVKPVKTKIFNGFVFKNTEKENLPFNSDLEILKSLSRKEKIWKCEPVEFVSEWRYYIDQGGIIGCARYDDGSEDSPAPNIDDVRQMTEIASNVFCHGFAMDVGVLASGETCLVELNDAWAIGLYDQSITPIAYFFWLLKRWTLMKKSSS